MTRALLFLQTATLRHPHHAGETSRMADADLSVGYRASSLLLLDFVWFACGSRDRPAPPPRPQVCRRNPQTSRRPPPPIAACAPGAWLFAVVALSMFGFHVYWARYAAERNAKFQELSYKDLRNRRLSESTLRGWIYDRKGRPLAYYKKE